MAGHSKWANIKHRKAAQDARRGKVFTRLIRELTTAARVGGSDPADNPRLRLAVDKASAANLPKSTLERAILRGSGELAGTDLLECLYEGYGPDGAAILVDVCTDNRNRTVASVRHAFSSHAGKLGTDGSVAWMFTRRGQLSVLSDDEEAVMEMAEAHADDIEPVPGGFLLYCEPDRLASLSRVAIEAELEVAESSTVFLPSQWLELDEESRNALEELVEELLSLDDVQDVYCNVRLKGESPGAVES